MLLLAAPALSQTAPDLGEAFDFTLLGTNASPTTGTVTCTDSLIDGNVGTTFDPAPDPPADGITTTNCTITGTITAPVDDAVVTDFDNAYNDLNTLNPTCDDDIPTTSAILPPGVYCSDAETTIGTGVTFTLNGSASDVWVFKVGTGGSGALTGTGFNVVMGEGAEACNVYWWTAEAATMTDSSFIGTVLSGDAITMTRGSWLGRAQATTDVTVTDAAPMTFAGCAPPAEITVNKDFSDDNPDPVLVDLTCTSGTVEDTPLDASEAAPAVFTVGAADPGATCTATETVPEGYTADQTDCEEVALDGSCTIINTLIPGSITIVKETFGGDGTFGFTGDFGAFDITTADGTGSQVFADVDPGTHDVTEIVPAGWDLTSITCSNDSATDVGTATASIEVAPEENVTCTFANSQLPGTLIVEKRTNPPGSDQIFTFTGDAAGDLTDGEQIVVGNLAPGNYSSTETVPEGWQLTSIICNDADSTGDLETATANFVLDADETVTCVFLNTEDDVEDGTITILKQASPPGTGQAFNFTGDLGNFSLMHGQFIIEPRPPGTYAVSETVPPGWQLDSATCDDGSPVDAIVLEAGENVTCRFANSILAVPAISVPVFSQGGVALLLLIMLLIASVFLQNSGLYRR